MGWNYLSIPKLQRYNRNFVPLVIKKCNYVSILGLELNHVSQRGHWCYIGIGTSIFGRNDVIRDSAISLHHEGWYCRFMGDATLTKNWGINFYCISITKHIISRRFGCVKAENHPKKLLWIGHYVKHGGRPFSQQRFHSFALVDSLTSRWCLCH